MNLFYLDKTSCDLCPISEVESSAAAETDDSSCGENEMESSPKRQKRDLPTVPDFNVVSNSTPQQVSNSLASLRSRFPLPPEGIIFCADFFY